MGARLRRLARPRPARVVVGEHGEPRALDGRAVESVVEDWVVEDRWWTDRPLRRRYFELVLSDHHTRRARARQTTQARAHHAGPRSTG